MLKCLINLVFLLFQMIQLEQVFQLCLYNRKESLLQRCIRLYNLLQLELLT